MNEQPTTLSMPGSPAPFFLVVNARIQTGDPRRPWADAVAVRHGRVEALGRSAELRKRYPTAVIVDACGMLMLPGTVGETISCGELADLVLLDSAPGEAGAASRDQGGIVLQLVRGYVTVDRTATIGTN